VCAFFGILASIQDATDDGPIVHITAFSPSDISRLPANEGEALIKKLHPVSPHRRYEASMIQFLDPPETLPLITNFNWLGLTWMIIEETRELPRTMDPATVGLILSRCPRVEYLWTIMMDWPRGDIEERKRRRKVLARVLDEVPEKLSRLHIVHWGSPPRDESYNPPVCWILERRRIRSALPLGGSAAGGTPTSS
jgi:hypothetical protein